MPVYITDEHGNYTPERVRARARLTVLSDDLHPEELTRRMGIDPDRSWRKGDLTRARRPQPHHGWELTSRLSDDRPVEDHLADVLERTAPIAGSVAAMARDPAVHSVRLMLSRSGDNWNPGLTISPEAIRQLDGLGIGVDIDIYVLPEDVNTLPEAPRPASPQLPH
jgi:hypothetical protein